MQCTSMCMCQHMFPYAYVSVHMQKGVDILSSTTHVPFRWCSGGCLASADTCGSKHVSLCITLPIVCHFVCFTTIALVIFHFSETFFCFSDFLSNFYVADPNTLFWDFFKLFAGIPIWHSCGPGYTHNARTGNKTLFGNLQICPSYLDPHSPLSARLLLTCTSHSQPVTWSRTPFLPIIGNCQEGV